MMDRIPTEERHSIGETHAESVDVPNSSRSRTEVSQRLARGDYSVASPKPDLVMGTENSPRGLVYYDNPQSSRHPSNISGPVTSSPKYSGNHEYPPHLQTSRSHPSNMYASLDRAVQRQR
ncbi:hypothetical protein EB796_003242 [Bugula neritina]|uniref:Uncharacterized protein n=1 Tax=Bugula neritina TaxID=10212 RepID=A0A7J7KIP2_BUGNE|nr:hypothetical protein EB796_003242 [Bugula neritina]